MIDNSSEQHLVALKIKEQLSHSFDVLINLDKEEHFIGTIFPDIVLVDKKNKTPLFIIEIKKNGRIPACMNLWKSAPSIPATLYMIVPKKELDTAKLYSTVTGLKLKFGTYEYDEINKRIISDVTFE